MECSYILSNVLKVLITIINFWEQKLRSSLKEDENKKKITVTSKKLKVKKFACISKFINVDL